VPGRASTCTDASGESARVGAGGKLTPFCRLKAHPLAVVGEGVRGADEPGSIVIDVTALLRPARRSRRVPSGTAPRLTDAGPARRRSVRPRLRPRPPRRLPEVWAVEPWRTPCRCPGTAPKVGGGSYVLVSRLLCGLYAGTLPGQVASFVGPRGPQLFFVNNLG
jgi:hypothetical protein